jgi:hypothetical protein
VEKVLGSIPSYSIFAVLNPIPDPSTCVELALEFHFVSVGKDVVFVQMLCQCCELAESRAISDRKAITR